MCAGTCLARGGTRPAALRGTPSYCVGCSRGSENVGGNTWLSLQRVVFRINRDVVVDQGQLLQSWTDRGQQNFVHICSPLGMSSRVKPARRFAAVLGGPRVSAEATSALFYRLRPDCAVSLPASASAPPCARSSSTCANQVAQPGPFNFRHAPWPRRLQEPRPAAHTLHMHTRADTGRVNAMLCRTDTAAANQQWGPSKTALVLLPRFVDHRKRRASRVSGKGPASADLVCCFFIGNRWGGQRGGKGGWC